MVRALFGRRPPPWLARPPLDAISRCFSGLIAANPRFEPPVFKFAISLLRLLPEPATQPSLRQFTLLIQVMTIAQNRVNRTPIHKVRGVALSVVPSLSTPAMMAVPMLGAALQLVS